MIPQEAEATYCCKPGAEDDIRIQGMCVSHRCMAWRWIVKPPDAPDQNKVGRGYCGLAGVPTITR